MASIRGSAAAMFEEDGRRWMADIRRLLCWKGVSSKAELRNGCKADGVHDLLQGNRGNTNARRVFIPSAIAVKRLVR